MTGRPRVIRAILVVLLFGGAYFPLQAWLHCASAVGGRLTSDMARVCTFGTGIPGFGQAMWPDLVVAAIYVGAAAWVARTKRIS